MKKLFLFLLLLPTLAYGQEWQGTRMDSDPAYEWQEARMNIGVVGGGTTAVASFTEEFYWTCEGANATARGTGTTAHRVTPVAGSYNTLSDCSSGQAHAGTYSFLTAAGDSYISFPITANNIINPTVGYLSLWVYIQTAPSTDKASLLESSTGAGGMRISIDSTRAAVFYYVDPASDYIEIATAAMSASAWHQVECRWNFTTDAYGIRLDGGEWVTSATVLGTPPTLTEVVFGSKDYNANSAVFYIDDVQIWGTFDAT